MATQPYTRYPLDPTGVNPDNLIVGEIRDLSNRPIRAAASAYGPFYTESLAVYDNITGRPLVPGVDYKLSELQAQATRAFNKEVALLVLIINPTVSSQIRFDMQIVGGDFQHNFENIVGMYESLLDDTRPVHWDDVSLKPVYYPPAPHTQPLSTIFGFEALVQMLENIRQAIILGNVPAFERLLERIEAFGLLIEEFDAGQEMKKYVTHEVLVHSARHLNHNTLYCTPQRVSVTPGRHYAYQFQSTYVPEGSRYYWTIEHHGTSVFDFLQNQGSFLISNNQGMFTLPVAAGSQDGTGYFDLVIRNGSSTGHEVFRFSNINMRKVPANKARNLAKVVTRCCFQSPNYSRSAKSYAYLRTMRRHDR